MKDPDRAIWDRLLSLLRTVHPAVCRHWFSDLEPLGVREGSLCVRALTDVHRDYLQRECGDAFADAARTAMGMLVSVRFFGPGDSETLPASVVETKPVRGGSETLVVNPDATFENFVVGPANRLAQAAAVAVADKPGQAFNPLFIHGGVGLGKSHLLQGICLRILSVRPGTTLQYLSCEAFMSRFWDAVQGGDTSRFRQAFRDVDVLIVDDIHFLAQRDRTQEEFFHTFNSLYQSNKQIVLSSDAPPELIPHLEERLVSRFKWGLVTPIEPPCYETRVAIVKTKAKLRGIAMPDDVAMLIASRIDNNIRELEGAITKIQILAMVDKKPIDLALAKSALGPAVAIAANDPSLQAIVGVVSEFFRVRLTDLQSKRRTRSLAVPRQVCMYLARRLTRLSLEEIGGHFGGRDHTTVMHAVRTVEARREADHSFSDTLAQFEVQLKP